MQTFKRVRLLWALELGGQVLETLFIWFFGLLKGNSYAKNAPFLIDFALCW